MKDERKVDCKKIERMIPRYLENKLSVYEMQAMLDHMRECKNCKEELTIQYMVSEGLNKAEIENDYNLLQSLENKIIDSYKQIKSHDFLYFGFVFCIIAIVCLVIGSVVTIIL